MGAILFAEDWQKHERAIVDLNTSNKSFVRLAQLYRSMGVKNHAFVLALHNPDLVGVDPHSKNLTPQQIGFIIAECFENPWYWLREVVRAPAIGGVDPRPIEGNRGIVAMYWLFENHIPQFDIQPRQTGKSFGSDSIDVRSLLVTCVNTKINLLTKDDELRRKNIRRIKEIMDDLPRYLDRRNKSDANNTEEITVNELGNVYSTHVPQASRKRALLAARGLTTAIFKIDEPPFQPNIDVALPAALASMGMATELAAAENAPHGVIMTTTAGKKDEREGRYIYKLLQESAPWSEMFFDCKDLEDLKKTVRANSRKGKLRVACIFNHRQLGKDDAWLARKLEEAIAEGSDADRDYFNVWTSGSQTNPIPVKILEKITESQTPPLYEQISSIGGYITRWYVNEDQVDARMNAGNVVMAMDSSDVSGRDDSTFLVLDSVTGDVLCTTVINETNLLVLGRWLANFLIRFRKLVFIPERKSSAPGILDQLFLYLSEAGIDPARRIFNTIVQDYENPDNQERYEEICRPLNRRDPKFFERYKRHFGFMTAGSGEMSRDSLYGSLLQLSAKRIGDKTRDKQLIEQITSLVIRNNRIDHPVGEHDDLVVAWLLANWLLVFGKNLNFYGIDSSKIFSRIVVKQYANDAEIYEEERQNKIREQVKNLSEQLVRERDDFISERIEQKIRMLMNQMTLEEDEVVSVDDLIRRAREIRRNKLRLQTGNGYQRTSQSVRPVDKMEFIPRDRPLYEYNGSAANRWTWS